MTAGRHRHGLGAILLTCFLFLAAQLRVQGDWPWWLSLGVAAPIALAFDVAFIRFADMSLPKGSVWG
jgi:hypothetical protein